MYAFDILALDGGTNAAPAAVKAGAALLPSGSVGGTDGASRKQAGPFSRTVAKIIPH